MREIDAKQSIYFILNNIIKGEIIMGFTWNYNSNQYNESQTGKSNLIPEGDYRAQIDVVSETMANNGRKGLEIELYVNGVSVLKHNNPYRCKYREEKALVHLNKGKNQIILRVYNRFENEITFLLRPSAEQVIYKQNVNLDVPADRIKIRRTGLATLHTDTELHNLRVK